MRFLYILFFLLLMYVIPCVSQTIFNPNLISGNRQNYIYSHTIDPLGNKYLSIFSWVGEPFTIYGKTYNLDMGAYVLRFDSNDSLTHIYDIWALRLGDIHIGDVQAMAADKYGNLYIAGVVGDGFVGYFGYTKLNPDGQILWQVKSHIGSSVDTKKILIDDQGNSYVAGTVESVIFFDVRLYQSIIYPPHDFLLKISPAGNLTWMHTSDASDEYVINSAMRFDNYGNIVLGGTFHTEIKIGSLSLTNPLGDNYSNMVIRCISPSGDLLWMKGFTGPGNFYMKDIEVDYEGNIYFTGGFHGSMTFGDITLTTRPWRDAGFILGKISNNFDVEWIKYNDSNNTSSGGYLANTSAGVLVSGAAPDDFIIDNLTLHGSTNYQAFVAKVLADGTTSWLNGYGEALHPGVYSETPTQYYFYPGYQLTAISDECYFISGNFVNTLNTNDGIISTEYRAIFTGIFAESAEPMNTDLGPEVYANLCGIDTCTIPLQSTLGTNHFSAVQGPLPTITFINTSSVKLSGIAYGLTKFRWIVQNCASISSKLITLNRTDSTALQDLSTTRFCNSQINNATVTVSGANVTWYDDELLMNALEIGNTFTPTHPDTVYATNGIDGCISTPIQVVISFVEDPQPPTGPTTQTLEAGKTVADLTVSGSDVKWFTTSGNAIPPNTPLENDSVYYATQTIMGCESQPFPVKISIVTTIENRDRSLLYYPNPVKDNLIISADKLLNVVVVKNTLGQILLTKEVYTSSTEIRLDTLQSGFYFIQVGFGEKAVNFKIAKE